MHLQMNNFKYLIFRTSFFKFLFMLLIWCNSIYFRCLYIFFSISDPSSSGGDNQASKHSRGFIESWGRPCSLGPPWPDSTPSLLWISAAWLPVCTAVFVVVLPMPGDQELWGWVIIFTLFCYKMQKQIHGSYNMTSPFTTKHPYTESVIGFYFRMWTRTIIWLTSK